MSTLSIVVLSVLAALFTIVLLAACSLLIYLLILQRRAITALTLTITNHSTLMSSIAPEFKTILASHNDHISQSVARINGAELRKAVSDFVAAIPLQAAIAKRIESAVISFAELCKLVAGEQSIGRSDIERARESGLLPDSYAPATPGDPAVTYSATARSDLQAREEESIQNQTRQGGPGEPVIPEFGTFDPEP